VLGGGARASWLAVAAALQASPLIQAAAATATSSSAAGGGGSGDAAALMGANAEARLRALHAGVALCRVFDALAAGQAESALVMAAESGIVPLDTARGEWVRGREVAAPVCVCRETDAGM
jgi:hypothetical protein